MTVGIWTDSNGDPGAAVGALSNPSTFVATSPDRTYRFTSSEGIFLKPNTTYWLVIDLSNTLSGSNYVRVTSSNAEDVLDALRGWHFGSGGDTGWSIGDVSKWRNVNDSGVWQNLSGGLSLKIRINGALRIPQPDYSNQALIRVNPDGSYTVSADLRLIPEGIAPGETFRLLFKSAHPRHGRNATSDKISDYDRVVTSAAANGHHDILPYSNFLKVVGSTSKVDARDNTQTTATGRRIVPFGWHPHEWNNPAPPTYWLRGEGGDSGRLRGPLRREWGSKTPKNEQGTTVTGNSEQTVFTGTRANGSTESVAPLGSGWVQVGNPTGTGTHAPLSPRPPNCHI